MGVGGVHGNVMEDRGHQCREGSEIMMCQYSDSGTHGSRT
jgi:hypothetical protein